MKKIALIYGITGQDGAYLANFLLKKNYIVHGVKRRSSSFNTERIDDIYNDLHNKTNFYLHYGDLTDSLSVLKIIKKINPNEIYNLGAQSHVGVSFEVPEYTANVDALGTLRILDSILTLGMKDRVKFYQAGTSEMFGASKPPQNEKTNFYPRSPYAAAKLYAYWITINYREAYGIYACNGILFNHESPIRGETFVTRKITRALARIKLGLQECLYLGNIGAKRDWGHAKDYVEMQWLMLQQEQPEDYTISTGEQHTVREFVEIAANYLDMKIVWDGSGVKERGIYQGNTIVCVDPRYFRPAEVDTLLGCSTKAKEKLGWIPRVSFKELVKEMVESDLKEAEKDQLCQTKGYLTYNYHE